MASFIVLRHIGRVNHIGLLALAKSQIPVFWQMKEWWLADIITLPLYILVTLVALEGNSYLIADLNYITYLGYGLLLSTCFLRAFESAAFMMMDTKINGSFLSFLNAPMLSWELLIIWSLTCLAYVLILGSLLLLILFAFGLSVPHFEWDGIAVLLLFCFTATCFGHFASLLSQKWDHIVGVDAFIFMPIMMLSGVFFSPSALPEFLAEFYNYNPFYLIIDSVRQNFSFGHSINVEVFVIVIIMSVISFLASVICLERGYGVKS